jgi:hypothetical protein
MGHISRHLPDVEDPALAHVYARLLRLAKRGRERQAQRQQAHVARPKVDKNPQSEAHSRG